MILFFLITSLFSQDPGDSEKFPVRITKGNFEIHFFLTDKKPGKVELNVSYHWYSGKDILVTQGGYAGKLLNGKFIKKGKDNQLLESGIYRNGLKHGTWQVWDHNGNLKQRTEWKSGIMYGKHEVYDNNGHLIYRVRLRNNRLHGKAEWFYNNEIVDECEFSSGYETQRKRSLKQW